MINDNLIIDIGVSGGYDTKFYLSKGFEVVGLEADPIMFAGLQGIFATEISESRLNLLNLAAANSEGEEISFWRNNTYQGLSSTINDMRSSQGGDQTEFKVKTINWNKLRYIKGIPYYLKIDIEGGEEDFMNSMMGAPEIPPFMSVEAHSFRPILMLKHIGYSKFKLVNQNILHTFDLPNPALEGKYVTPPDWSLASGPFGKELPGIWVDFETITDLWHSCQKLLRHRTMLHTWFDCHACI